MVTALNCRKKQDARINLRQLIFGADGGGGVCMGIDTTSAIVMVYERILYMREVDRSVE